MTPNKGGCVLDCSLVQCLLQNIHKLGVFSIAFTPDLSFISVHLLSWKSIASLPSIHGDEFSYLDGCIFLLILSTRKGNQRSNLILEHSIWVLFQIYGSVDEYKIQPGPFYRLVVLLHTILLFPTTVLFDRAGFVGVAAHLVQGNAALHRRKVAVHLTKPQQWQTVKCEDYLLSH